MKKKSVKTLNTSITASAFDEDTELSMVYCMDREQDYCFSLTRAPLDDDGLIEIMVMDQINHRVNDLNVTLHTQRIEVELDNAVSEQLDKKYNAYCIHFEASPEILKQIATALHAIFKDKNGLTDLSQTSENR